MSATAEKMALTLAHKYAERMEETSVRHQQLKGALFEGICIGVHAAGYCMTPAGVFTVVMEAYKKVGPRPAVTAMNLERKQWAADMVEAIVTHNWFC